MISFDFEYYRPSTLDEATNLFKALDIQCKFPMYYSGGTEIISMARKNQIVTKAVIDIKEIPECNLLEDKDNKLTIGSAVTLTKLRETNLFPLLSSIARHVTDHTLRDKITIGGNICSRIPYREMVLPFLLSDSLLVLAGPLGKRNISIHDVFDEALGLEKGEMLVQIITDKDYSVLPFVSIKKTRGETLDYPLITAAAIKKNDDIRIAFSGICRFPFRSKKIEAEINGNASKDKKFESILGYMPGPITDDILGSSEYRKFVFKNMLSDTLEKIGGITGV